MSQSALAAIRSALKTNQLCAGVWPVAPLDLCLCYSDPDGVMHRLDFSKASVDELDKLSNACHPATFGLKGENVYDENYRKAGKLDAENIFLKFNPANTGLLDWVQDNMFHDPGKDRPIEAELYKLNVYGKDSFFKAHFDTPRSEKMFGSLVIVFPTPHIGGSFVVRHQNREASFDSGAQLQDKSTPKVGYMAFFSDVEHEVMPVTSGHRVTVTYNLLYRERTSNPVGAKVQLGNEEILRHAFTKMISDPSFLPNGGILGFGLAHLYPRPVEEYSSQGDDAKPLESYLKGIDAVLFRVLKEASVQPQIRFLHWNDREYTLFEMPLVIGRYSSYYDSNPCDEAGGIRIRYPDEYCGGDQVEMDVDTGEDGETNVRWISTPRGDEFIEQTYAHYGNEPSVGYLYVEVCLTVDLGDVKSRMQMGIIHQAIGQAWLDKAKETSRSDTVGNLA